MMDVAALHKLRYKSATGYLTAMVANYLGRPEELQIPLKRWLLIDSKLDHLHTYKHKDTEVRISDTFIFIREIHDSAGEYRPYRRVNWEPTEGLLKVARKYNLRFDPASGYLYARVLNSTGSREDVVLFLDDWKEVKSEVSHMDKYRSGPITVYISDRKIGITEDYGGSGKSGRFDRIAWDP